MTAHSFYAALQEAQTQDEMAATIIQYLLGATEYRRFVDLLIDRKLYHYGPGSAHALATASSSSGDGGVSNAASKESSSGGESDGHMSKISDEVDDTAGQIKDRVGFRRDEAAADFSRKVSDPNFEEASDVGMKENEQSSDPMSQRK